MKTEKVSFYSEGCRLGALWRRPDDPPANGRLRVIVQGPGWLGMKDSRLYVRYHEALTAAGFGVLIFDYRGFGDSEGDRHRLVLTDQLRDLINAVTYVAARDDVDPDAIGVFGTGGTGGGNAVLLAAADERIRAAVSQVPVADGEDWLHRMRAEHEWLAFLRALAEDRTQRVLTGTGQMVSPLEEIMVPTPERRATTVKSDVDDRVPAKVPLAVADEIIAYRPVEVAAGLTTPLLVIGVENDATTPSDHAHRLYEAARGPKALIMQRHTTHYAAYDQYWNEVTPRIVAWFNDYVKPADLVMRWSTNAPGDADRLEVLK
jgi:dipeptidyl aminopeptidase/acylaminoacyl peptidase